MCYTAQVEVREQEPPPVNENHEILKSGEATFSSRKTVFSHLPVVVSLAVVVHKHIMKTAEQGDRRDFYDVSSAPYNFT